VILISLMLSWLTAVTITPLFCNKFFGSPKQKDEAKEKDAGSDDPYAGGFYRGYRSFLEACIRVRWVTVGVIAAIFAVSMFAFGHVKNNFFPDSTRPQFFIDFHFPEGVQIQEVADRLQLATEYFNDLGAEQVVVTCGGGDMRFLLTYSPPQARSAYGQLLVTVDDYKIIKPNEMDWQRDLDAMFPDAVVDVRQFLLGPGEGGKIQIRVSGHDLPEIRRRSEVV
jgi:multidrug efflux pump subunit AcrB